MDLRRLELAVETCWDNEILKSLCDYISIPCQSPAFDSAHESDVLLVASEAEIA